MKRAALILALALTLHMPLAAQDYQKYTPEALDNEMAAAALADISVMVPMRDGVRLSTNIYRPKDAKGPLPVILWKTPYNEHKLKGMGLQLALKAVKRGYVFIVQNERGRYFSEGKYQILGYPQTDGYDALSWIAKQPWSNGKVGTLGCSSTAEWQLALAAQNHPAHAAMVPMAAGAGIGKVGRFHEQGNWYTGGVPRSLFFVWLYGVDTPFNPQLPQDLDPKLRPLVTSYNDLAATKPKIDWNKQIQHLPVDKMLSDLGEPRQTFDELIARDGPADPAWRQGGLYHDDMGWGVPALWFNSWYDVSIGPNMELYNHARTVKSDAEASANQYAVIAPNPHCQFWPQGKDVKVGDRMMPDGAFETDKAIFGWFDRWLKGDRRAWDANTPAVRYYTMGGGWQGAQSWPPKDVKTLRMYLRSGGSANSLYGDGRLDRAAPPAGERPDLFRYDPMNPVQTVGGADCCNGGIVVPGAFDQRAVEARNDVLVYTSEPLKEPIEVTGFVDAVLKVSSSAKDSDFTVKLVDVDQTGTAWIIGDTIFRARYRNGFDKPELMQPGQVYTIKPSPITTSIRFGAGHRIRVEVSSSTSPKWVRNLNTGGRNESESKGVVAVNTIHHAGDDASYIELPVAK
jgi:putative CocE/NonD family hydrolase